MSCKPPCIEEIVGTDREKWEYVKAYYGGMNGPADYLNTEFTNDWANWQADVAAGRNTIFEKWLQWRFETGSIYYGNLPHWTKDQHVGHCYAPCPYSTQSVDQRTRSMLGLAPTDPLPTRNDHTSGGVVYYMKTEGKGSVWGFECTFDTCPYYTDNGKRYFYV